MQTTHYANRRRIATRPDAVIGVLRALGADLSTPADVPAALRERRHALESRVLEPVHVLWDGGTGAVHVNTTGGEIECSLRLESGDIREWRSPGGEPVALPALPFGYHRLVVRDAGAEHQCLIISAPSRAFSPPADGRTKAKKWGAFLPLYALHSDGDWGAGDFTGLQRLAAFTGRLGGSFVATLPIMSAFLDDPFDPSPYAPVSRLFWNEFYVNVDCVPELEACPEGRDLIASPAFQRDLVRLRSAPFVDYRGVMAMKRRVLSLLARVLTGPRLDAFNTFLRDRPQLQDYARFRAAGDRYRARWSDWPDPARSGRLDRADFDLDSVRYYEYVQWLADSQLHSLSRDAADSGVSLYLDLPIGASRDSYDLWRQRSLFAEHASAGAPPDAFFPQGQDWAFPPPHPDAIRAEGYALFIAVVRRLLEISGVLRIDHVMGLHRLYWIAEGMGAADGVYVHYRPEELYAILCLESHRYGAVIVGEDLGTVPAYVPKSLARHNIYSMYVLQYSLSGQGPPRVAHARRHAVAGHNTHDTPPFAAWLKGADIDDALRLGFLSAEAAGPARAARSAQRQTLARLLYGRLAPRSPSRRDLLLGSLRYLAGSRSELMLVNLEDLWLETRPQNIPGTTADRHPNWRRRAARTLEDIEADAGITATLREVNSARTAGRP